MNNLIIMTFLLLGASLGISLINVIQRGKGWENLILVVVAIAVFWIGVLEVQ